MDKFNYYERTILSCLFLNNFISYENLYAIFYPYKGSCITQVIFRLNKKIAKYHLCIKSKNRKGYYLYIC